MVEPILSAGALPFCKGCGHHLVAWNLQKALHQARVDPLDVILVSDIGCHGIIDEYLTTHTVHGLHGRSPALAAGISAALEDPRKKIIVFIGDGGATIGLGHLIAAAQRNFRMCVVVHNNMLYGMTGGQPSGLTPPGFNTPVRLGGESPPGLDLCRMFRAAGAAHVSRILARGDFAPALLAALQVEGFALVEVIELCPSYAVRPNPGFKLSGFVADSGLELGTHSGPVRGAFRAGPPQAARSLLDDLTTLVRTGPSGLAGPLSIVVGGSAGHRVQWAATLFAEAAMTRGLQVTKKGRYPVTVGTGYSVAEITLSPGPIGYHGVTVPDLAVITSADGLSYCQARIEQMTGTLYLDAELEVPRTAARIERAGFRRRVGEKESALAALACLLEHTRLFDPAALFERLGAPEAGTAHDVKLTPETVTELARGLAPGLRGEAGEPV